MSRDARAGDALTVVVDGTPLLGQRTGIGRYTEHLLTELGRRPDVAVTATALSLRGYRALPGAVPPGIRTRSTAFPVSVLRAAWRHVDLPRIEWLAGRSDVVHGTNFVLPPGSAAGVVTVHDLVWHDRPGTLRAENRDLTTLVPRALRRARAVITLAEVTRARIAGEFG